MLKLVIFVLVMAGVVGVGVYTHIIPKPKLQSLSLPRSAPVMPLTKSLEEIRSSASASVSAQAPGKVAGISTEKLNGIGQTISEKGSGVAQTVTSLLNAKDGEKQVTIDVQAISDQIGVQMEKLPAQLVEKAKVAYCQQVLIDATKSATEN